MKFMFNQTKFQVFPPVRLCSGDTFKIFDRGRMIMRKGSIHRLGLYDYAISTPKRLYVGHSIFISLGYWFKSMLSGKFYPISYYI